MGDTRRFGAITARAYPYMGVAQPTVLLFDVAQLLARARRPAAWWGRGGRWPHADSGALPGARAPQPRPVAVRRNVDLTGDGVVDLVVSAPGAERERRRPGGRCSCSPAAPP
ncbi:MAG: hypothetical protein IPJ65_26840 [Archangiaceae bacterium]|nr:hypothetical protein [Archangiaceae bacterium]